MNRNRKLEEKQNLFSKVYQKNLFQHLSDEELLDKKKRAEIAQEEAEKEKGSKISLFTHIGEDEEVVEEKQKPVEENEGKGLETSSAVDPMMKNVLQCIAKDDASIMSFEQYETNQPAMPFGQFKTNLLPYGANIETSSGNSKRQSGVMQRETAQFCFDNKGLYAIDNGRSKYIGNFAVEFLEEKVIVDEIVNESNDVIGTEESRWWHIRLAVANMSYEGWVEGGELMKLTWVDSISHNRGSIDDTQGAKRLFKEYLNRLILAERHQVVTEYTSAGWKWTKGNYVFYLTSNGPIGYENTSIRAVAGFDLAVPVMTQETAFNEVMQMRNIIAKNPQNAVALQYYPFLAVLTSIFKKCGCQIEFSLALIGKTNTKKTSCGEVFTRIYNRKPNAVPDINFSSTQVAIYEIMDKYADMVVMIDDLTPAEDNRDGCDKARKFESIIRAYGDRVPRRRSTSFAQNSSAKEFTPITGCALITGESFDVGKSSRSRVLVLDFNEGDVDDELLSSYQDNLNNLPNLIYYFLIYTTGKIGRAMETIVKIYADVRREIKSFIKTPRYVDTYAAYRSVMQIFHDYAIEESLMDRQSADEMLNQDIRLILNLIIQNDRKVALISPGVTILQALKYEIDEKRIRILPLDQVTGAESLNATLIEDSDYFYI